MKTNKILVAEDDPALLHSLVIRLRSEGFEVLSATNGNDAVALAQEHTPEMLILDVHLPSGDGFSVQQRVQLLPGLDRIPIIYVTGDDSPALAEKARDGGVTLLLKKPFNTAGLLYLVRHTLERFRRAEEPEEALVVEWPEA
jgi:two-component system, OmpR family, KDP operon response regulator KdpE